LNGKKSSFTNIDTSALKPWFKSRHGRKKIDAF